jgi:hypothetical protein
VIRENIKLWAKEEKEALKETHRSNGKAHKKSTAKKKASSGKKSVSGKRKVAKRA